MSKKYTVTLKDDLAERYDACKDSINLSQCCQQGLLPKLEYIERRDRPFEEKDMESVIERLKREKEEFEQDIKADGLKAGRVDAPYYHYSSLKTIVDFTDELNGNPYLEASALLDRLDDIGSDGEDIQTTHLENLPKEDWNLFLDGYIDGILAFWEQVEPKL